MIKEDKSKWSAVAEMMEKSENIELGNYISYNIHNAPRRILYTLSYYKFAAKLIGKGKTVLDMGSNEGIGTWVLAKECGKAIGMDFDTDAIASAKSNFADPSIEFCVRDFMEEEKFDIPVDATTSFDVIEHIKPEKEDQFFSFTKKSLTENGICIVGTPSEISQQFANAITKKGHINIYSPERLEKTMRKHFTHVFMFACHDEIVHTGYLPLAHYLLAVGVKKRS